jgi:hypothetical protein
LENVAGHANEVKSTIGVVVDDARRFRRAHEAWLAAVASRARVAKRADRRIAHATGGLSVDQWKSRCCRTRINTGTDSRSVARAVRAEVYVRQAVADADHLRAEADAKVRTAKADLTSAARALLRHGTLGESLAGVVLEEPSDLVPLLHADDRRSRL